MAKNKVLFIDFANTLTTGTNLRQDAEKFLKEAGKEYYLCIVSDVRLTDIREFLQRNRIYDYFDFIANSREYDTFKPDPFLINISLVEIKDRYNVQIKKEDCFLIGDRPDKDILMGNTAKVKTIRLLDGPYKQKEPEGKSEIPDFNVNNLREALNIIIKKESKKQKSGQDQRKAKKTKKKR